MVMKQKRIMKYLSGCLALLGLTVSCNDELYMGGVGGVGGVWSQPRRLITYIRIC